MTLTVAAEERLSSQLWWSVAHELPEPVANFVPAQAMAELIGRAADLAETDLMALAGRDPAADSATYALQSYQSFRAVLAHRLAHEIHVLSGTVEPGAGAALSICARDLAERTKTATGVEIHPSASIGPGFVIDHGSGTVIGETVTIGSYCYLLQGVVLGATRIADNPSGKRHPTLGDRVEVGSFARVLGPVMIGDDCVIDPHTVTTFDVPANSRVSMITQCQVARREEVCSVSGVRLCPRRITVWGEELSQVRPVLVAADGRRTELAVETRKRSELVAELPPEVGCDGTEDLLLIGMTPALAAPVIVRLSHQWRGRSERRCDGCGGPEVRR